MYITLVEARVAVIEQSMEGQDASLQYITASLQLLAAALEVQLPPPPASSARASRRTSFRSTRVSSRVRGRHAPLNPDTAAASIQANFRGRKSRRSS